MTQGEGSPAPEPTSKSFVRRLNKLQNLVLQGSAELAGPSVDDIPLSKRYVAFGPDGPQLRENGVSTVEVFNDDTLAALAKDDADRSLDLVFADGSCIDLSFRLPDALLPELKQIIENEVKFRSPFSEDASYAIWVGEEQVDGSWRARAAVMLKSAVDPALAQLEKHGLRVGIVRRAAKGASYAAQPEWATKQKTRTPYKVVRNLPAPLKLGAVGAAVFCASAIVSTILGNMTLNQTRTEAENARAILAAQAQSMASIQQLDASLALATDKLAMAGTLSALLPDGVWLDQLVVDDDTVTIVGFAPSAADLTRILSTLPQLEDIRFASPVTRDNSQNLERFRISATLAGTSQ